VTTPSFEVELVGLVLVIGENNCPAGARGRNTPTGDSASAAALIFGVEHENGAATPATVAVRATTAATADWMGVSVARGMSVAVAMVGPGVTIARASVAVAVVRASVALGFTVSRGATTSFGFA